MARSLGSRLQDGKAKGRADWLMPALFHSHRFCLEIDVDRDTWPAVVAVVAVVVTGRLAVVVVASLRLAVILVMRIAPALAAVLLLVLVVVTLGSANRACSESERQNAC